MLSSSIIPTRIWCMRFSFGMVYLGTFRGLGFSLLLVCFGFLGSSSLPCFNKILLKRVNRFFFLTFLSLSLSLSTCYIIINLLHIHLTFSFSPFTLLCMVLTTAFESLKVQWTSILLCTDICRFN